MKIIAFSFILGALFNLATALGASTCERSLEYRWVNADEAVLAADDDDYRQLIELSSQGSGFRNYQIPHIAKVFAREVNIYSPSEVRHVFCDSPSLKDVDHLKKSFLARGFNLGIYDFKAMIEMALIYDQSYFFIEGYFADYKKIFELINLFFTSEKIDAPVGYRLKREIYSPRFLQFLQKNYEFREIFLETLNPNIIIWNKTHLLTGHELINKRGRAHEKRYSDFMFAFLRETSTQEKLFKSGMNRPSSFIGSSVVMDKTHVDARELLFVNPDLIDFSRLYIYKEKFQVTDENLVKEIIKMTRSDGGSDLGDIVTLLEKKRSSK